MNDPENLVVRWLRLKQESGKQQSGAASQPMPAEPAPEASTVDEMPSSGSRNEQLPQEPETPPAATFDPACLPPIESITGGSDIRLFMQSGVPAELMRAALRAAWVADPTIRDFVGIAESQWDFNDPTAMPGFGPMEAIDSVRSLAAHAASRLDISPGTIAQTSESTGQLVGETVSPAPERQVDAFRRSSSMAEEKSPGVETGCRAPEKGRVVADIPEPHAETDKRLGGRVHGSALPKLA
jgi:hypothetical protein